ncbi:MAG: YbbR-like domain-containing protein [Treponema sp.]|nr:YbbR-like domain-containing protein [Treponema sp.]
MNSKQLLAKITENWPAKVLSLAAALIISVFHRMNLIETRVINSPLRIEANESLLPASSFAHFVRVNIRGDSKAIYPVPEEDIEPYIDLNYYTREGVYQVPVQVRKKGIGADALEITTEPMEITIRLEKKLSRSIMVIPVFHGDVTDGYVLERSSLIPSFVIAEGPASIIEMKSDFRTETINLDGRYGDFSVTVNIINDNPFVQIRGNGIIEYRGTIKRKINEDISGDYSQ